MSPEHRPNPAEAAHQRDRHGFSRFLVNGHTSGRQLACRPAHYELTGRALAILEARLRDRDQAHLRVTLGDAASEAACRHGRTLSQADAIALATAAAEPDPRAEPALTVPASGQAADGSAGPLSEREREIVALLAGGATDAQIAGRLFLSVNTVRSHLERIRDKTGARRRAELVRYAIQAGIDPVAPPA